MDTFNVPIPKIRDISIPAQQTPRPYYFVSIPALPGSVGNWKEEVPKVWREPRSNYYLELKTCTTTATAASLSKSSYDSEELILRRRKVRSMRETSYINNQVNEERHSITVSGIEHILKHISKNGVKNRSLDTLLSCIVAEAERNDLKNKIVKGSSKILIEALQERAAMILKLTKKQIDYAKSYLSSDDSNVNTDGTFPICSLSGSNTVDNQTKESVGDGSNASSFYSTTSDFTPEIEISSVLNYTQSSINTTAKDSVASHKDIETNTSNRSRSLIPVRMWSQMMSKSVKESCDFSCQASTLNESVLKKVLHVGYKYTKTTLAKNIESFATHVSNYCTEAYTPIKKRSQLSVRFGVTQFKTDGYTLAYLTRIKRFKDDEI
ncbi:hypothetical protein FQA39_LY07319 [Lamprigera yunnana]|nr:hypothetical protein FQA39_LY07319 [Lamprigera yunnana]